MTNRLSQLTQKGRKFLPKKREVKGSIAETVKKEDLKIVKGLKIEEEQEKKQRSFNCVQPLSLRATSPFLTWFSEQIVFSTHYNKKGYYKKQKDFWFILEPFDPEKYKIKEK